MSFRTLTPAAGTSSGGAQFGFNVNSRGKGLHKLVFTIHPDIISQVNWQSTTHLKLEIDEEERKGRLTSVTAGSVGCRKLKLTKTRRGLFHFPYSGEVMNFFRSYESVYELDNMKAETTGITFDLPPEDEEEESEA